jgi:regulator of cell morphogenesis and NO signaling
VLHNRNGLLGVVTEEVEMNEKNVTRENGGLAIRPDQTAADLVIRYPHLRLALERLGLDYCCGGHRTLAEAARRAGLELDTVLSELRAVAAPSADTGESIDWAAADLTRLADHILTTHHVFTRSQIARIQALSDSVSAAHRDRHGALLDRLAEGFGRLREELEAHLMKEEQILFPAIKAIDAYCAGNGPRPVVHCGSVAHPIRQMEYEHDGAGEALAEMRRLTDGYRLPADACPTFAALYEALETLERDLHQHIHLENNILFPASVRQEASITPRAQA